jgi:UDPglucose 6-dehydrogenase
MSIGIIGYGMVGKAVEFGFQGCQKYISDPEINDITVEQICAENPEAIFVCVPTPTDGTNFEILTGVLDQIQNCGYKGVTVVKSTVLPQHLQGRDNVVYNPEFLSRATSFQDFIRPPMLILGGKRADDLLAVYSKYSLIDTPNVIITDINTAAFAKYAMNSFYALKITYMNSLYDVATKLKIDWPNVVDIFKKQPWMGTHHFEVPGPDGDRGFGGPCLPKDTEAFADAFQIDLLKQVLKMNDEFRNN